MDMKLFILWFGSADPGPTSIRLVGPFEDPNRIIEYVKRTNKDDNPCWQTVWLDQSDFNVTSTSVECLVPVIAPEDEV